MSCADTAPQPVLVAAETSAAAVEAPQPKRMVAIDLDGTLLTSTREPCADAMAHLKALRDCGGDTVRVIATGRNVQAAAKVIGPASPVDYVVAGSGGIVIDWRTQEVVARRTLTGAARSIAAALVEARTPFLLLKAPPRNHECLVFRPPSPTAAELDTIAMREMTRRLGGEDHTEGQHAFCADLLDEVEASEGGFGGFLLMGVLDVEAQQAYISKHAPEGTIRFVQLTSTQDPGSVWLEVLPADVSKASGLAAVAERHGIDQSEVVAIGNDWNDLDMLEWAGAGVAMGNTPDPFKDHLRQSLPHVHIIERTNDDGGVHHGLQTFVPTTPAPVAPAASAVQQPSNDVTSASTAQPTA